jgi:hypothetical protein
MRVLALLGALALSVGATAPASAGEIEWLPSLEKGLDAARKSGRAVLYVTLWKPGT